MDDESPTSSSDDDAATDERAADPSRTDAAARASDLAAMSDAASDATWGEGDAGRNVVPGVLSGDLGPKGRVSAQLRDLSRRERSSYGEVPPGAVQPGGFGLLLLPMLGIALALVALVALVGWLLS